MFQSYSWLLSYDDYSVHLLIINLLVSYTSDTDFTKALNGYTLKINVQINILLLQKAYIQHEDKELNELSSQSLIVALRYIQCLGCKGSLIRERAHLSTILTTTPTTNTLHVTFYLYYTVYLCYILYPLILNFFFPISKHQYMLHSLPECYKFFFPYFSPLLPTFPVLSFSSFSLPFSLHFNKFIAITVMQHMPIKMWYLKSYHKNHKVLGEMQFRFIFIIRIL